MRAKRRPAILFVAPAMPAASGNGLAMRLGLFLEALVEVGEVDLVVLPLTGPFVPSSLCEALGVRPQCIDVAGRVDTHYSLIMGLRDSLERCEAFASYCRPSLTASLSLPVLADLRAMIDGRRYDLVHLSRAYLLPVLALWPENQATPLISVDLDEDDVSARQRLGELFRLRGDGGRADWEILEAQAFERLYKAWLKRAGIVMIASKVEQTSITSRHSDVDVIVVPNAVHIPELSQAPADGGVLFVGSFGYFPNLDAALWLCEEIWPRLRQAARLTLVGRDPPARLINSASRCAIDLRSDVTDLAPLYRRTVLALAPMRAGGGTRLKIVEAAAWAIPTVSTPVGAEGLDLADGRHLWIADDSPGFAAACAEALVCPGERRRRGTAARRLVNDDYNRRKVAKELAEMMSRRLDKAHRGDAPRSVGTNT